MKNVLGDSVYTGADTRPKLERCKAAFLIAAKRSKVEHPFRVIKRQFGYTKVRYLGWAKHAAQVLTLFALSNLWMVRRQLMPA